VDEPVPIRAEARNVSSADGVGRGCGLDERPAHYARCALSSTERNAIEAALTKGCHQFVSRRRKTPGLLTDSTARNAWSDTVWTAFTALSRWSHGFEPRWGCSYSPRSEAWAFFMSRGIDHHQRARS
jgi:hypothetical protein